LRYASIAVCAAVLALPVMAQSPAAAGGGNSVSSPTQSESSTLAVTLPDAPSDASSVASSRSATAAIAPNQAPIIPARGNRGLSRLGVGVTMSLLGPGVEAAYQVTPHINVRGGFNFFDYTANFTNDGINYGGTLKFQSGEAHLDYFLWHSLHVSPGVLFSKADPLNANLNVPGGNTFTLSGTTYESNPVSPLGGTGTLKFKTVAPSILFGFGNLVPRGRHHFSVRFEVGGAFRGTPNVALNFTGSACDSTGANCQTANSNSTFQTSVLSQQTKFNNDISFLKFYPIVSLGFGFKL
jgi:hypothetical protein